MKFAKFALAGLTCLSLITLSGMSQAAPIVVDFEGVVASDSITVESGTRTFGNGAVFFTSHGHIIGNSSGNPQSATNGTANYFHDNNEAFTLDTADNSLFSLTQFEMGRWFADQNDTQSVVVTGTYGTGGTIISIFTTTVGIGHSMNTFILGTGWSGLTSLSFDSDYSGNYGVFDNIVLNGSDPSPVPAPGALALLGLGLLGIGALRRKKKLAP